MRNSAALHVRRSAMNARFILMMVLIGTTALAEPDAGVAAGADSGTLACDQHITWGEGTLWLSGWQSKLALNYTGPMESDIGRYYKMSLATSVSGRTLWVTIATRSVPSSGPGGPTLDAFGTNGGTLALPMLLPGRSELVVRQGRAVSRFVLDKGTDVTVTPIGKPNPSLFFSAVRWRATPPDAGIIDCQWRSACGFEVCQRFLRDSALLNALTKLEDGMYLSVTRSDLACAVLLTPESAAQAQRELEALDDGGCATVRTFPLPSAGSELH